MLNFTKRIQLGWLELINQKIVSRMEDTFVSCYAGFNGASWRGDDGSVREEMETAG